VERGPGGAEEHAGGSEIPWLWVRAWCATPYVLLVNHGVEKPSRS
jgi:hypothetical protein